MSAVGENSEGTPGEKTDGFEGTRHAYEGLRSYILEGRLEPGAAFSQVQLAGQLGVSRTPLREAVRLLQMEGLVHSEYNRRVTVAPLTPSGCDGLYAMRIALEPLAVRLTVARLSTAELDEIGRELEKLDAAIEAGDIAGGREPHRRFHFGLFAHGGPELVARVADLWDHAERFRLLYSREAAVEQSLQRMSKAEHRAILQAARSGHEILASTLVAEHLGRVVLTTLAQVDSRYDPRAVRTALAMHGADAASKR